MIVTAMTEYQTLGGDKVSNADIRKELKKTGVTQWQVAMYLGISESTMTRKMRCELDNETKSDILNAIRTLNCKNENN